MRSKWGVGRPAAMVWLRARRRRRRAVADAASRALRAAAAWCCCAALTLTRAEEGDEDHWKEDWEDFGVAGGLVPKDGRKKLDELKLWESKPWPDRYKVVPAHCPTPFPWKLIQAEVSWDKCMSQCDEDDTCIGFLYCNASMHDYDSKPLVVRMPTNRKIGLELEPSSTMVSGANGALRDAGGAQCVGKHITSINGTAIRTVDDIRNALSQPEVGSNVEISCSDQISKEGLRGLQQSLKHAPRSPLEDMFSKCIKKQGLCIIKGTMNPPFEPSKLCPGGCQCMFNWHEIWRRPKV